MWEPDMAVVDAVLDGRATLKTLEDEDRCVVVAALTARGETVEQIADRLECCTRQVKRIRAQALTATLVRAERAESQCREVESRCARATDAAQRFADAQTQRIEGLRGQVESLVGSVRRLRIQLANEQAKQQVVHLMCYRRRPTPRLMQQAGQGMFEV